MMEKINVELVSSLATVVLAILAVFVFIYHGADALFYVTVLVAMVVGFLNAWLITRAAPVASAAKAVSNVAAKAHRAVSKKKAVRKR